MIKNYITIAWRNLYSNRLFSVINMISLAIGISASLVIGLIVYYDFSFDNFHPDGQRIYRITTDFYQKEGDFHNYGVTIPLGTTVKQGMPGVETASAFYTVFPVKVKSGKSEYKKPQFVTYADENFFKIFDYKWLAGSKEKALLNPNQVVLTKSRAQKYFGEIGISQMLGRTLVYDDSISVNIAGIVADFDKPTDLVFQEFISAKTAYQSDMKGRIYNDEWNNTTSASQVFIKVNNGANLTSIQKQLDVLAKEHTDKESAKYGQTRKFHLQPLRDIHFNKQYGTFDFGKPVASKPVLYSLMGIAAFLLLLGSINFINLSTAQATQRAKEIGVRKTLGGSKKQLMMQFLGETFLLTFFSALLSIGLSALLIRYFADFIPQGLNFNLILNPVILTGIALLVVLVTLASGLYPALVLTRFKPVLVLKNQSLTGNTKSSLRKFLTVSQFVIAQIFIMATVLVGKQIHYMMNKDMGFKKDAIAYIAMPNHDTSYTKKMVFLQKIKAISQVQNASIGGAAPASYTSNSWGLDFADGKKQVHTDVQMLFGDVNYLNLYKIKLLAGRNLMTDTAKEYIINETYARVLGFKNPADAVGKILINPDKPFPVVGVIADFNLHSLHTEIKPMAFIGDMYRSAQKTQFHTIHFALDTQNPQNWPKAIEAAKKAFKSLYPEDDFEATFLDASIKSFYESERRISTLLSWATGLSVLISCLGLLGLVIYTTEKRSKEIGIRKVLGASLIHLTRLLSVDFLWLVVLAFVIAAPVAWWGAHNWLQDFAYKTSISWWVFLLSGLGMMLMALAIMSIKTIQTALANPVKSLRSE